MNRGLQQRLDALNKANLVRTGKAVFKRELAAMPRDEAVAVLERVLLRPPPVLAAARLGELLLACPGVGVAKRDQLLRQAGRPVRGVALSPSLRLSDCSPAARVQLATVLHRLSPSHESKEAA